MANLASIRSVGHSLTEYLTNSYRDAEFPLGADKPGCTFSVVSSGQMQTQDDPGSQAVQVLLYLYRVGIDSHLRNSGRLMAPDARPLPLSLELHYLVSFWSRSADSEQLALAWTMRQLHLNPLLDRSILGADAGWSAEEAVQIVPAELSNEDTMRIWDAVAPSYRLSVPYVARVVRIDPDDVTDALPVVATRMRYGVPREET